MKIIKLLGNLFLLPLYWLSYIVPRNKNIWVFGSWFGTRYSDSSRYIFEYIYETEPGIRAIWLTRKKAIVNELRKSGYEAYSIYSINGYWLTCRAAVAIFTVNISDVNTLGASKLLKFQLWHGIPLKKIVHDDQYNSSKNKSNFFTLLTKIKSILLPYLNVFDQWDVVTSTSPKVSMIFESAFRLHESKIFETGTPRADVILTKNPVSPEVLSSKTNKISIKHRIGYFPTHRKNAKQLSIFINSINNSRLIQFLEEQESVLYIKLHYYNLEKHVHEISSPRIVLLKEDDISDINYLLPWIDILITDYSSVYYDFLLLNRPIIFTPFDLDEYMSNDRELYGEYNELTPGPKCTTWNMVVEELYQLKKHNDKYYKFRTNMKKEYYSHVDMNNSQRVVQTIRDLIQNSR